MGITREQFAERAANDGVEFFFAMFVDMHGKPCAKLIPIQAIDLLMDGGAGFAGFAAGPMGQSPADPDMLAVPDLDTYARAPWQPNTAVVQCDIHVDGEPWPYSPRVILKRQLAELAERGWVLKTGVEAEYFLVRRTPGGGIELADPIDTAALPCYDAKALTRMFPHLSVVSRYMNELGWANYANDHEDANGQFEQNFTFADALTTADRLIFYRYMVHTLANNVGLAATFMPKPFVNLTGNGLHVHTSLWDAESDTTLFTADDDARNLGLSPLAYQFAAGLIEHATAMAAVTCPSVNSYKRFGVGAPASGATWAPAYATYGGNNRTQMLRVPEAGRLENRGVDGAANPYLAFTVMLAAGLDGIDRKLDPGEPNTDNLHVMDPAVLAARGIRAMPPTLLHAADNLVADDVLRRALGTVPGGDYIDYFAATKRAEFMDYHSVVSAWEVDRYLSLF